MRWLHFDKTIYVKLRFTFSMDLIWLNVCLWGLGGVCWKTGSIENKANFSYQLLLVLGLKLSLITRVRGKELPITTEKQSKAFVLSNLLLDSVEFLD